MRARKAFQCFNFIFMLFIIFFTAYPFYYVLITSFSDPHAFSVFRGFLVLPLEPYTTRAYEIVFSNQLILSGFRNTLIVLVVGVCMNILLTVLGAYFLNIQGPMFKNGVALMIVFTMYFSGGLIPSYLNVRDFGLLNSLWALIIPGAINTTNLIIMKSSFASVPISLVEAAQLDGASYFQILRKVMIPLCKATLAVMVLYYGVGHWNAWFGASIYLNDPDLYPVQLVMRNLLDNAGQLVNEMDEMAEYKESIRYALIIVTTAPILVLYPFLQKYFTKGVMIGAVKG